MEFSKTIRVLILTDFTQTCYDSVTYGLDFCRYYGFQAEILHVETPFVDGYVDVVERQRVSDIASLYNKKFSIGANVVIKNGVLSEVISDEVKLGDFKVIILGTHGREGWQSVTGSAAAKIITSQVVPIIVVQSKKFSPIKTALLPISKSMMDGAVVAKIIDMLNLMSSEVEIVCRKEEHEICHCFTNQLKCSKLRVHYSDFSSNFSKQVIEYGSANAVDMFIGLSSEAGHVRLDNMMEQLMFNIPQIPVMCAN